MITIILAFKINYLLFFVNSLLFTILELAIFGTGQRGRTVLLYNGQKFVKNRSSPSRTYWICSRKVCITLQYIFILFRDY